MAKSAKTEEQLANEQKIAETQGTYGISIEKEGTKQKLIEAISNRYTANAQAKNVGVSPLLVIVLVIFSMMGVAVFLDRKSVKVENAIKG
jgi:hypothetical protein